MNMHGRFEDERGEVVELIPGGGHLPDGLTEGFQVRVVRRLEGDRRLVEREGREWIVPLGQIRFRRRFPAAVAVAICETWDRPLRGVRPHGPVHRGVVIIDPGLRRAGH